MSLLYLQHHDAAKLALAYDSATGEYREVLRGADLPESKLARGFYVSAGGTFVGVYASDKGPVCFHGRTRYRLAEPGYQADLSSTPEQGRSFSLQRDQEELFRIHYAPPAALGSPYWPDDDEEFNDFFAWLKSNLGNPKFFSYYTDPSIAAPAP